MDTAGATIASTVNAAETITAAAATRQPAEIMDADRPCAAAECAAMVERAVAVGAECMPHLRITMAAADPRATVVAADTKAVAVVDTRVVVVVVVAAVIRVAAVVDRTVAAADTSSL
jgi:hypothetical protein